MEYSRKIFGYECDVYGHLNNANYLHIYEEARADALEKIDLSVQKLIEMDLQIYITHISLQYKKGLPIGSKIKIESTIIKSTRASSIWLQKVYNADGELCNQAEVKGVFVRDGKPLRIDKDLYEKLINSMK